MAATQRRDSINAQLANVRQMLATLTGVAPTTLMDQAMGSSAEQHDREQAEHDLTDGDQTDVEQPEHGADREEAEHGALTP